MPSQLIRVFSGKKIKLCFVILITSLSFLYSQNQNLVYFIGENQEHYHQLSLSHSTSLLEVCDFDMNEAYAEWHSFMAGFEKYAAQSDFNLEGVKLWINVYWAKNGRLQNIVFYEKPNSKLTDYNILKGIFTKFVTAGYEGKKFSKPYSHYGSVSFPLVNNDFLAKEK